MSVFAIPNPKKKIQVDFPIEKIRESIKNIPLINPKYKFFSANEAFNQYTLESFEFLSLGVYVDIHLNSINENKTEIQIEIRRKVGTFNQSHEITNANRHIDNLYNYIAQLTVASPTEIENLKNKISTQTIKSNSHSKTVTLILCFFLGIFGVHRFYTKNILFGVIQFFTLGCFGIWTLVDFILILTNNYKDGNNNKLV
jgi:hypothetical protein